MNNSHRQILAQPEGDASNAEPSLTETGDAPDFVTQLVERIVLLTEAVRTYTEMSSHSHYTPYCPKPDPLDNARLAKLKASIEGYLHMLSLTGLAGDKQNEGSNRTEAAGSITAESPDDRNKRTVSQRAGSNLQQYHRMRASQAANTIRVPPRLPTAAIPRPATSQQIVTNAPTSSSNPPSRDSIEGAQLPVIDRSRYAAQLNALVTETADCLDTLTAISTPIAGLVDPFPVGAIDTQCLSDLYQTADSYQTRVLPGWDQQSAATTSMSTQQGRHAAEDVLPGSASLQYSSAPSALMQPPSHTSASMQ